MVTDEVRSRVPEGTGHTVNGPHALLRRIPLLLRMSFYGLFFFLGLVLVALPWLCYRLDVWLPAWHMEIGWWRLAGVAVFLGFLAVYAYCSYELTSRGQGAYIEFDPPSKFVGEGPYRWVRNPVAACVVGVVLGEAIAFSSTGIFMLFVAAMPLAHLQVVLLEEPLLRKRFGPVYEEYLRRVPRWIPRRPGKELA